MESLTKSQWIWRNCCWDFGRDYLGELSGTIPREIFEGIPGEITERVSGEMSGGNIGDISEGTLDGISGSFP